MSQEDDFFSLYLDYTSNNEAPKFFHRWSMITSIGALLGRNYYFKFGHQTLVPNTYCMLLGTPGTRKSTSIKIAKGLLKQVGYDTIAADKTTKEKFLLDLAGHKTTKDSNGSNFLDENLGEEEDEDNLIGNRELFIAADEFNDFFGNNGIEFVSLLGTLWDFEGVYKNRIKNGVSVAIPNPTVSILGGNTPTGFSLAFPPEILGQGFFSRILLIYGESSGKKIAFPVPPTTAQTKAILDALVNIKINAVGEVTLTPDAEKALDTIYTTWKGIDDVRFESYSNRRFTHLLKLCLIHSACRLYKDSTTGNGHNQITTEDVIYANTVLTHTEHLMPRALGEFGRARNSEVVHKIMQILEAATSPIDIPKLHAQVLRDVSGIRELGEMMASLKLAGKIQSVNGGFLPKRVVQDTQASAWVDYDLLTPEEKDIGK